LLFHSLLSYKVGLLETRLRIVKKQTQLSEVLATVYWFGDSAAATVVVDGVSPGFYREGERKEWRRRLGLGKKKRISHCGPPRVDSFGILDLQVLMKLVTKWLSL
jgi:hypothetical protein